MKANLLDRLHGVTVMVDYWRLFNCNVRGQHLIVFNV
jgi:hypothetical protein